MEESLIWSRRSACHLLGLYPSAVSISPRTSPFQDVLLCPFSVWGLNFVKRSCAVGAESGQMLKGGRERRRGWCCGPVEFDCYTAVYLPMHLCILSRQHPRAYKWRAETRARLSSPIPCRDNVLAIKEIYSYSDKAGNGNQVKQGTISACALCMAAAFLLLPFLLPHCSPSPKEMSGLHFVCAGSSASAFQQWYFPGQSLSKHFPGICLLSVVWDRELDLRSDPQLLSLLLPLSSWAVSLTEGGMQMCGEVSASHVRQV